MEEFKFFMVALPSDRLRKPRRDREEEEQRSGNSYYARLLDNLLFHFGQPASAGEPPRFDAMPIPAALCQKEDSLRIGRLVDSCGGVTISSRWALTSASRQRSVGNRASILPLFSDPLN